MEPQNRTYIEEVIQVNGRQLIHALKQILKQSNLVHLTIIRKGQILLSIPVTLSMVIFYLYPLISMLSTIYLINHRYTIKILKLNQ